MGGATSSVSSLEAALTAAREREEGLGEEVAATREAMEMQADLEQWHLVQVMKA